MNRKKLSLVAKVVLAASLAFLLYPDGPAAGPPRNSPDGELQLPEQYFRHVTTIPIQVTQNGINLLLNSSLGDLYLIDMGAGKLRHENWKTKESGNWVALDPSGCSQNSFPIKRVSLMEKTPNMVVLNCNRVELIDKLTFSRVRTILEDDQLRPVGFALSPDGQLLAITVRKGVDDRTRIYQTHDWKVLNESSFANASFTSDSRLLATSIFRRANSSAVVADKCGLQFYDPLSGKLVSEWLRSVDELANICPQFPLFFRPTKPNRVVSEDILHGAISEWNAAEETLVQHLKSKVNHPGPAPGPLSLSPSYDGKLFGVVWWRTEPAQEYGVTIWDLSKGKAIFEVPLGEQKHPIKGVIFSTDSADLAVEYEDRIEIYHYETP